MIKQKLKETPVTWVVFLLCILVFTIARITKPENIRFLALIYQEFSERWYTIVTYSIVHVEWYHIILNMGILIFIGSWVEKMLGIKRYLMLIILSAFVGGLSLVLRETGGIGFSAAASGILFYYYLAFPWERELPLNLPNVVLPLLLVILSVCAIIFKWLPTVGHYPHIAGAAMGTVLLLLFRKNHNEI